MPARAQLASEIAALRALPRPDLAGSALELGSLAARVDALPVAGTVAAPGSEATPAAQSAWRRALARVRAALAGLVTVRRSNGEQFTPLPEQRYFLYRSLELELEAARLALLRGEAAEYTQSIEAAERALQTRFDADDPGVQSALATLGKLKGIELVPAWPDISGSLAELRRSETQ
jgi:uroporphyrin-3 C-methyltransferase